MRHAIDRRKLSRDTAHRKAMLANLAKSLIEHERIETTVARAKELRRVIDRYITKGKQGTIAARRLVTGDLQQKTIVKKIFEDLAPRFQDRNGGYTRIVRKSSRRRGDGAEVALIEFVDYKLPTPVTPEKKAPAKKAKSATPKSETASK